MIISVAGLCRWLVGFFKQDTAFYILGSRKSLDLNLNSFRFQELSACLIR